MKNISILLLLFCCQFLAAQSNTTTIEVERLDDSTFVQTTKVVDPQGRVLTVQNDYYSDGEFAQLVVQTANNDLAAIDRRESNLAAQRVEINKLRRYVIDSIGVDYDSIRATVNQGFYTGEFNLIERDTANVVTTVTVSPNPVNPKVYRIVESDGAQRTGAIFPIHRQKFEIRNFYDEFVEMAKIDATRWRGVLTDGTVIILRQ